jgi:hypothetical protein
MFCRYREGRRGADEEAAVNCELLKELPNLARSYICVYEFVDCRYNVLVTFDIIE